MSDTAVIRTLHNGEWVVGSGVPGVAPEDVTEFQSAALAFPTVWTRNHTRHLDRFDSINAAIADLPDGTGQIYMDGEYTIDAMQSVPAGVELIGRGSGATVLRAPVAGFNFTMIDLLDASNAALHGFSVLGVEGQDPGSNGNGIRIRGDSDDVTLDDIVASHELMRPIVIQGTDVTTGTPAWTGMVERLTLNNVRAFRSYRNFGITLAFVDGVDFTDVWSNDNWMDGVKLLAMVHTFRWKGGGANDNIRGYQADPNTYNGNGIDGFAGGDTFLLSSLEFKRNGGAGFQIKSGSLNTGTNADVYGYVRNIEVANITAEYNEGSGGLFTVAGNVNDPALPMVQNIIVDGGMYNYNGGDGMYVRARNVTLYGTHAIRNDGAGFVFATRSSDIVGYGLHAIANDGYGINILGHNTALDRPVVVGRYENHVGQESDLAGTVYTSVGVQIGSTATGEIEVNQPSIRYCEDNRVRVSAAADETLRRVIVRTTGANNPPNGLSGPAGYGGIGSEHIHNDATVPWDIYWVKRSGVSSSSSGWVRAANDHTFTTAERPTASSVGAGFRGFDTTLGKPIWSNGTAWVDATGAAV